MISNPTTQVQRQELELKMQARMQHNDNEAFLELFEAHSNLKKVLWPGLVGAGVFGLVLGYAPPPPRTAHAHILNLYLFPPPGLSNRQHPAALTMMAQWPTHGQHTVDITTNTRSTH